jgi:hypothetical protein
MQAAMTVLRARIWDTTKEGLLEDMERAEIAEDMETVETVEEGVVVMAEEVETGPEQYAR